MKTILFLLVVSQVWASCPNGQFSCSGENEFRECIPKSWVCDNIPDCVDGKDEKNCTYRRSCAAEQLMCPDKCVSRDSKCDGKRDCANGDDEADCEGQDIGHLREFLNKSSCAAPMYRCKMTKTCLPKTSVCNRVKECPLGDDEENCPNTKHVFCPEGHKLCRNEQNCIVESHICDGRKECEDGSDEWECVSHPQTPWASYCGADEFRCVGFPVECIHISRMCDGRKDCQFGDDEGVCHLCEDLQCEHKCQFIKRTTDGDYIPSCLCPRGAVLMEDRKSCHVPDYCKTDKGRACQHFCRGDGQKASCSCAPGYNLAEDGVSCLSITQDGHIVLAAGPEINSILLFPSDSSSESVTILNDTIFGENVSIDYLPHTVVLGTYTTNGSETDGILAIFQNGRFYILKEKRSVAAVAADSYGQNIFFVVKGPSHRAGIHVCTLDGVFCKRLIEFEDSNSFGNLVLDLSRGAMYFTETNSNVSQIIKASMDGTNSSVIHESKSSRLNGLAIDSIRQELYFGDSANGNIVKINLHTLESSIVLEHSDFYPLDMKFLDGFLYCTQWPDRVWAVDVRSPNVTRTIIHRADNIVSGLTFSSTIYMPSPSKNPCASSHCIWLCVPTLAENKTLVATCLCPDGYHDLYEDSACHPSNRPPPSFDLSPSYLEKLCYNLTACVNRIPCSPFSGKGGRCVCPVGREGLRCELENAHFEEKEPATEKRVQSEKNEPPVLVHIFHFILVLITMSIISYVCLFALTTENCRARSKQRVIVWKNRLCSIAPVSTNYDLLDIELHTRDTSSVRQTNRENVLFRSESTQDLVRPDSIIPVQSID